MASILNLIEYRAGDTIPAAPADWLRQLASAVLIRVPGKSSHRCRLVVTLLHGNEPSGVMGCHRFLRENVLGAGVSPRVDLYFYIANVAAALMAPLFSLRQCPGERDINRCFVNPANDRSGEIAQEIMALMNDLKPEAVIDIHNTSGDGPSFSVCTSPYNKHLAITALFTHRVVVTDLRLGALIDLTSVDVPVVTIECGGAKTETSHQLAYDGIQRIAAGVDILSVSPDKEFDIYFHPVRLELGLDTKISVGEANDPEADITLPGNFTERNFGYVTPDIPLAWVNNPECLTVSRAPGIASFEDYFLIRQGRLHCAHPLKLFMVTTNIEIAKSDCLLYAVKEIDHNHLMDQ